MAFKLVLNQTSLSCWNFGNKIFVTFFLFPRNFFSFVVDAIISLKDDDDQIFFCSPTNERSSPEIADCPDEGVGGQVRQRDIGQKDTSLMDT